MFELATKVFGLLINEKPTSFEGKAIDNGVDDGTAPESVCAKEVRFYDLIDRQSGQHLGSFYADWHQQ